MLINTSAMRLEVLTESTKLEVTPINLNVNCKVVSNEHSLTSDFNPEISREFIKGLNIEKVKEAVSAESPYVTSFFNAVLNRDYEAVLDVIYPVMSALNGRYANKSQVVAEFTPVLSLSSMYFDEVNQLIEFYRTLEGESSQVLNKVKAIYDRFKNNRGKVFEGIFPIYEEYLGTLKDGTETRKSGKVKQALYSEFVKNQMMIEDVLDEISSISKNKLEKSPYEAISGANYDKVAKYFEDNRSSVRKIASKLLFLAYLDGLVGAEQGNTYSVNKFSKFAPKKDKEDVLSAIREIISSKYSGNYKASVSSDGFSLVFDNISSTEFERVHEILPTIGTDVSLDITMLEMFSEIKELPMYAFYYTYDEVFGTKTFLEKTAGLLDTESPRSATVILNSQPMPEDFDLGSYSFLASGNSIKISKISNSQYDKVEKYIKFFAILKDFDRAVYETEVSKLVKRLSKNPENVFTHGDVLRSLRKSKGESLNTLTYGILKGALKNPETSMDASYVLNYIAYNKAMSDRDITKPFEILFKKALISNQDAILDDLTRRSKGDTAKLDKIKDFLMDFESVLSPETLKRLGVFSNAE